MFCESALGGEGGEKIIADETLSFGCVFFFRMHYVIRLRTEELIPMTLLVQD